MYDNPSSGTGFMFSGSVPEHYDRFLGPMYFEPYAVDISQRFDPAQMQKVLEIGCGTGRVTRNLRKVLPESSALIASDISPDMMAVAIEKLKGLNIEWQIIDAQQLPFEEDSFDLVVSCFAFMFVEDKSKAFAEAYRVLKKGGTFLLALWDKLELNEASNTYREIVKKYIPDQLPTLYSIPHSFNDPVEVKRYFTEAGFSHVIIEQVQKMAVSESAHEAAFGLSHGGSLYTEIMSRNPAWVDEICLELEKVLIEKYGDSPMAVPMSAVVCQAVRA